MLAYHTPTIVIRNTISSWQLFCELSVYPVCVCLSDAEFSNVPAAASFI